MKYRKKPIVIEVCRWFKNGDHPKDGQEIGRLGLLTEGKLVRYYRTPELDGQNHCKHCGIIMHDHGWIETLEGGHIVCPGDWIIEGVEGEFYPCKPSVFYSTYEKVEDNNADSFAKAE